MRMQNSSLPNAIPCEVALRLCEQISEANRGKWYSFNGLWCLGCVAASKDDPTKRCWHNAPHNRGCGQVNARYDHQLQAIG